MGLHSLSDGSLCARTQSGGPQYNPSWHRKPTVLFQDTLEEAEQFFIDFWSDVVFTLNSQFYQIIQGGLLSLLL